MAIELPFKPQVERKNVKLRPHQQEWAPRAKEIILQNHGYIDTSRMGHGKTYIVLWLAQQFGFELVIVCPATVIDVWETTAAEYGVTIKKIVSYQSLRSQRDCQPKHGMLRRFDRETEGGKRQVMFTPTEEYLSWIEIGIMVVGDEIQNVKNNSAQHKAFSALIRPVLTHGGRSRYALLSGTPFDKQCHAINLLRMIGYIRSHRLFTYVTETRTLVLEGVQELIDACERIDPNETQAVLSEFRMIKSKIPAIVYNLYTRVVKATLSGSMPAPATIEGEFDIKNGFYRLTTDAEYRLQQGVMALARATQFNPETRQVMHEGNNFGAITTALVMIENTKVEIYVRLATQDLMNDPNTKVVIGVNYTSTLDDIVELMYHFDPLILVGSGKHKTSVTKRAHIIKQFQTDPSRRLLIMNMKIGGVGISLHDTEGTHPRKAYLSSGYDMLTILQASHRVYRDGTMSPATVRIVYGNMTGTSREIQILNAMARKSEVLKGTLDTRNDEMPLPGDYPEEREA